MSVEPWSVPVAIAEIPETGRSLHVVADAQVRAAVAKAAGVPGVTRLEVDFELTKHGSGGVRVVGQVSATVAQNCVLTLEPMENEVVEEIDLLFTPLAAAIADNGEAAYATGDEPPEALRDGIVDIGALATEFLILGIDPYPRKPGSVFEAPRPQESPASHPFAALAALKKTKPDQDT
jgi:uncharacterized metal-binding protein YceD (DUF177 family)